MVTDLYDLRGAFTAAAAWAPDDDPAEPAPDHSPDDADNAPADVAGEGEGQEGEAPDNPELKKVHDEAARHRVRAKDAETKAEALADQVRTLTLRIAFNGLAGDANVTDLEAAWKLAADDLRAVDIADDGAVDTERLGQIVAHVAERYPYLASAPAPATTTSTDAFPPTEPSGSRLGSGKRRHTGGLDVARLEAKFPALRQMRPR
ncbi:MAG: hypothetical protein ACR2G7_14005 [Acidimicrobiales bacterium]